MKGVSHEKRSIKKSAVAGLAGLIAGGILAGQAFASNQQLMEDVMPLKTQRPKPNMEPMIVHPKDEADATKILDDFTKATGKRPNILLFLMDDVGWGDLGCFGGGTMLGAPTPVMDSLARDGVMLTSTYSQPSSSPTRASILTGRLPVRHGILQPPMYGQGGGLDGEVTIAKLLKDAGYVTQGVGKWHVGENTASQPQNVGFDDFYGFLSVSDMYTEWRDPNFYPDVVYSPGRTRMISELPFEKDVVHTTSRENGGKYEKIKTIDLQTIKNLDTEFTKYSADFIRKMKGSPKPFFLYYGTRGAHFDNYPPDSFRGKSFSKMPYRDVMMELDHHMGTLVQTLKDTGQLENTIIFITSDNGPEMESWPDAGYTPFRGAKGSTLEGGMRVPGIVYWKGRIAGDRVADGLFDLMDLYPTFARIGGVKSLPGDRYIDGIDQTSYWLTANGQSNRKAVFYWDTNYFAGVRVAELKLQTLAIDDRPFDVVNNGGFSKNLSTGSRIYNLHIDPKEERSYAIRRLVYDSTLRALTEEHIGTFKQYPPKAKIKEM